MAATKYPMSFWHARYQQQAGWTAGLRGYLLPRAGISEARRVLDVGCGTGVLLDEIATSSRSGVHGLDIDQNALAWAKRSAPLASLVCGDALHLPYASRVFDLAVCHFVLLWLADPLQALQEMTRTVRPGGAIVALAEPDYGGRIDHPGALEVVGRLQTDSLREQGADPRMGRKLTGLFHRAGLSQVESGVLGAQWTEMPAAQNFDLEWQVLLHDLKKSSELHQSPDADRLRAAAAWKSDERVLYVPTFYAWGIKP